MIPRILFKSLPNRIPLRNFFDFLDRRRNLLRALHVKAAWGDLRLIHHELELLVEARETRSTRTRSIRFTLIFAETLRRINFFGVPRTSHRSACVESAHTIHTRIRSVR